MTDYIDVRELDSLYEKLPADIHRALKELKFRWILKLGWCKCSLFCEARKRSIVNYDCIYNKVSY